MTEIDVEGILRTFKSNPRAQIESTFQILDKETSTRVPFIFTPAQDDYWSKITARDLVLKSRKLGFSSIRLARIIARGDSMPNMRAVVVSHESEATERLLGRAHYMIDNSRLSIKTSRKGHRTITFPHKDGDSTVWIGTAGSRAFGRGDDITDYHLSEFAFWEHPDIITGIEEACVKHSEGCIESTGKGWGTPYHKLWNKAVDKKEGMKMPDGSPVFYKSHFYGWNWDPKAFVACENPIEDLDAYERKIKEVYNLSYGQLLWRRLKIGSMSEPELFPQEYPISPEEAFLVAGMMVFDPDALRQHEKTAREPLWTCEIEDRGGKVNFEHCDNGRLTVYLPPKKGVKYILPADVSAGIKGGAESVIDVFDCSSGEQVAQWSGMTSPDELGRIMMMLGSWYNWGLLAPEVNNHGLVTCTVIRDEEYPHIYTRLESKGGTDMGFFTQPGEQGTRAQLIAGARTGVREYTLKINSPKTISQCRTFVRLDNGKLDHQIGCLSDAVITLGIGAILLTEHYAIPESGNRPGSGRFSIRRKSGMISRPTGGYV